MRLIGYVRVSTEDQADNTSLDDQRRRIVAYGEAYGHDIELICSDTASGATLDRPGVRIVLDRLAEADGLIVIRLDRLSRSMRDTFRLIDEVFIGAGKALISVSEQLDTATPTGRAMLGMLATFAAYERDLIRERTARGREAKKSAGGYHAGRPGYGQRAQDGALVNDQHEQMILDLIRRHDRSGKSLCAIAAWLNDQGHTTKTGSQWTHVQVRRALATILRGYYGSSSPGEQHPAPMQTGN